MLEWAEGAVEWVSGLATGEALFAGVFLAALIETVFPPVPTLAVFPLAGAAASQSGMGPLEAAALGVTGGAGATAGSTAIYAAAWRLGRPALARYLRRVRVGEAGLERAEAWFARYGDKAVLFGRMVPVLREMVSVPAGLLRMRPAKFLAYTAAGSCAWGAATVLAGYYLGAAALGAAG